jgi:hypothetical protein
VQHNMLAILHNGLQLLTIALGGPHWTAPSTTAPAVHMLAD